MANRPGGVIVRVKKPRYPCTVCLVTVMLLAGLLSGCPDNGSVTPGNEFPETYCECLGCTEPETVRSLGISFACSTEPLSALGVSFEWRLHVGLECDSVAGARPDSPVWIETEDPRVQLGFSDPILTPDGPYVFQMRAVDEHGVVDPTPFTECFYVSIQEAPICSLTEVPNPRLGLPEATYRFEAKKYSRQGEEIFANFEYSWQFSRIEPGPQEIMYFWSNWIPMTGDPPEGTANVSGLQGGFKYLFQLKARDVLYPGIESEQCAHEFED